MAGKAGWSRYRTIGAVALDAYYASTAKPLPQEEPQRRAARRQAPREQTQSGASVFAWIGGAICAGLMLLAMVGGLRLSEAGREIRRLEGAVQVLEAERESLQSQLDGMIDLDSLALQARLMGMQSREKAKKIPVSVDKPLEEPQKAEKENPVESVLRAIAESWQGFLEYFRGD